MKAEQAFEIINTMKLQMSGEEKEKLETMILNQAENEKYKLSQFLAKFNKKHKIKQIKNF
ncbi:hypothetical protein QP519_11210 [Weeksella virosa]|uniref:hypothetical protein n=1 Tax=Weeksella virosa TaxID=1014 RepID=UPI0025535499|nr:hypothetical protein [Weeksella virosa]MDK7376100.1 hypothetical protein [Weeksella virosa]